MEMELFPSLGQYEDTNGRCWSRVAFSELRACDCCGGSIRVGLQHPDTGEVVCTRHVPHRYCRRCGQDKTGQPTAEPTFLCARCLVLEGPERGAA